ncbi:MULTISPECIES: phosphoadenylyl-sulfate reductase [unclassified Polynucleobacter]|uniref:phosphoadenylyl-sulfate reductase n=1 Tax=unclassified Polynucleobacter TaxID=2640945 RepID=UPI002491D5D8|nr:MULTISPECIES: phosphoadenylyl-sulfate reductase [unclassified Polynucleobacter]
MPESHVTLAQVDHLFERLVTRLKQIADKYQDVRFATSLAAEDMVITDAIAKENIRIQLFTLNTGRLHQSTLDMHQLVQEHYKIHIQAIEPNSELVKQFVLERGLNGFYHSEDAKKKCCDIRKVQPLQKALQGADAWLTGQRREQAVTRAQLEFEEQDQARGITKFNPIFDFSEKEIWAYLQKRQVPIHALHLQGYPSIGCEPCTRAIKQNEDIRAGRWWWLQQDSKECGLHVAESVEK